MTSPFVERERYRVQLPAPIGTVELRVTTQNVRRFQELTCACGLGPPDGIDLSEPHGFHHIDGKTFALLVYALAEQRPQIEIADLVRVCALPDVVLTVVYPVAQFVALGLLRLYADKWGIHGTN